jgi:hypothetical protein
MAGSPIGAIVMWTLAASLVLIAGTILFGMLTGRIQLDGLLRTEKDAPVGFERLQLLAVTLLFAVGYVVTSLSRGPDDSLPDIQTPLLLILIGSHGAYIAVKTATLRGGKGRGS